MTADGIENTEETLTRKSQDCSAKAPTRHAAARRTARQPGAVPDRCVEDKKSISERRDVILLYWERLPPEARVSTVRTAVPGRTKPFPACERAAQRRHRWWCSWAPARSMHLGLLLQRLQS